MNKEQEEQRCKTMERMDYFIDEEMSQNVSVLQHVDFPTTDLVQAYIDGQLFFQGTVEETLEKLEEKEFF